MNKGEIIPYFSEAYGKTKQWFQSSKEETDHASPPPPHPHLVGQNNANTSPQYKSSGMNSKDYSRAVLRLKNSLPEVEKKHGKESQQMGETLYTLASMLEINGQPKEAKMYFQKSELILSKWLGAKHPNVRKIRNKINSL